MIKKVQKESLLFFLFLLLTFWFFVLGHHSLEVHLLRLWRFWLFHHYLFYLLTLNYYLFLFQLSGYVLIYIAIYNDFLEFLHAIVGDVLRGLMPIGVLFDQLYG